LTRRECISSSSLATATPTEIQGSAWYPSLIWLWPAPIAGSDAADAAWLEVNELLHLRPGPAFDHGQILRDGLDRARSKLEYTPLATAFCPREFTIAELRKVYEVVWGTELDPRNFHRKVTGTSGFVVDTKKVRVERGRPAQVYRVGNLRLLNPPMLRPGLALTR